MTQEREKRDPVCPWTNLDTISYVITMFYKFFIFFVFFPFEQPRGHKSSGLVLAHRFLVRVPVLKTDGLRSRAYDFCQSLTPTVDVVWREGGTTALVAVVVLMIVFRLEEVECLGWQWSTSLHGQLLLLLS